MYQCAGTFGAAELFRSDEPIYTFRGSKKGNNERHDLVLDLDWSHSDLNVSPLLKHNIYTINIVTTSQIGEGILLVTNK